MMRSTLLVMVVFAVSCGGAAGEKGPAGDQGPNGEQGPRGEPGYSGLVWVDANGALVGPYAENPIYVDDAGVLWPVDIETAEFILQNYPLTFQSGDCTGPGFFCNAPPSPVAFRSGAALATRDGTTAQQTTDAGSILRRVLLSDGGVEETCQPQQFALTLECVPASTVRSISGPNTTFTAPLSIEVR